MASEKANNISILNANRQDVADEESVRQLEYIEKAKAQVSFMEKELGRKLKACVVTFGCQMNARDSEKLLATLKLVGYEETEELQACIIDAGFRYNADGCGPVNGHGIKYFT